MITLRQCINWLSDRAGDSLSSTTTGDGDEDKTTFIDASLARFPDGWIEDWWITLGEKKGWILPASHNDPDSEWNYEERAYDEDTDTKASTTVSEDGWGSYLEFTTTAFKCFTISVTANASDNIIAWVGGPPQ